jgi:2-polyprenyl-6-methoxyphenol hydroxylase-like FAD-dependent oxidoreductase
MMLGFLLARAGVPVVVLEKHADFLHDFRGDTIHPSTLELIHELGLLDRFLALPHEKVRQLPVPIGSETITVADFGRLSSHAKFIAMMPQWDFLNFVATEAARYPGFRLVMRAELTELFEAGGRIAGVHATTPEGPLEVRALLVVGADGRGSVVRERAGLHVDDLGAPMDVLWFRLSRQPGDPDQTRGRFDPGRIFVSIYRGEHWQFGYVVPKGGIEDTHRRGLPAFRAEIARLAPYAAGRVDELSTWDDVKLLTVKVDRLREWCRPGLLCIGDAAHAMSPVGGIGINLAIQDAVAAANLLWRPLRDNQLTVEHLRQVQRRRQFPTRLTQWLQVVVQTRIISRVLRTTTAFRPPLGLRLFDRFPWLRRFPARLVGIGVRPEHVQSPSIPA